MRKRAGGDEEGTEQRTLPPTQEFYDPPWGCDLRKQSSKNALLMLGTIPRNLREGCRDSALCARGTREAPRADPSGLSHHR